MSKLLILSIVLSVAFSLVNAAVPGLINYQGFLTDTAGDPVADASYPVVFTIYDAFFTSVWTEPQNVTTTNGLFTVLLGSVNPIHDTVFTGKTRYLGIAVNGDPEITPRTALVSVPYAHRVSTVDSASGGNINSKVSIGLMHDNSGDDAFTAGYHNEASGSRSVALGWGSEASGAWSAVLGGVGNIASNQATVVCGGTDNVASGVKATVVGGDENYAGGNYSFVGGGIADSANAYGSTIGGGKGNKTWGMYSVVVGGGGASEIDTNSASGIVSAILGGCRNVSGGDFSTVGGGRYNRARGPYSVVAGGGGSADTDSNSAIGEASTISGGRGNVVLGDYSTIGGGLGNSTDTSSCTIGGGSSNTAEGRTSTISGGAGNIASGVQSIIAGGLSNHTDSSWSTVGGGQQNQAIGKGAVASGGTHNHALAKGATVSGGYVGRATGEFSVISGGGGPVFADSNLASGESSAIPGGRRNIAAGDFSFAAGLRAQANHDGCFVWADSTDADFASQAEDQFLIRANGGVGINTNDPSAPLDIKSVWGSGEEILRFSMERAWAFRQYSATANTCLELKSLEAGSTKDFLITTDGSVGISEVNPMAKLHVNGSICYVGTIGACSDQRYKSDITDIPNSLDQVMQMRGISYKWKQDEYPDKNFDDETHLGFIAQEVEEFYPEMVMTDDNGFKSVDYSRMAPVLVEAMKELKAENDVMKAQIAEMQALLEQLLAERQ
jgi:Chaperone of endosialidase